MPINKYFTFTLKGFNQENLHLSKNDPQRWDINTNTSFPMSRTVEYVVITIKTLRWYSVVFENDQN